MYRLAARLVAAALVLPACVSPRGSCPGNNVYTAGGVVAAPVALSCAGPAEEFEGIAYRRYEGSGVGREVCHRIRDDRLGPVIAHRFGRPDDGQASPPVWLMREIVGVERATAVAVRLSDGGDPCATRWSLAVAGATDPRSAMRLQREITESVPATLLFLPPRGPSDAVLSVSHDSWSIHDLALSQGGVLRFEVVDGTHGLTIGEHLSTGALRGPVRRRIVLDLAPGVYDFRCPVVAYMVGGRLTVT